MRAFEAFACVGLLAVACGGSVVVDDPGAAGAGGGTTTSTASTTTSTTTTTTTTTTTVTGAGGCDVLLADLASKIGEARSCDQFIDILQCTGTAIVYDECGCPMVANELNPQAVSAAIEAFNAAQTCAVPCSQPCRSPGPSYCKSGPDGGYCAFQ